jgi:SAM-dependent methyltransferase
MTFEQEYYEAPEFWADGALTNAGTMVRIRETIATVPSDARSLLDVGCGNGVFVNTLSRERPELKVTATDRSRAALRFVETEKFESDVSNIGVPDRSFDCVTCLQVIEHLPHGIYERSLAELARVAGRYLIVSVPFQEDLSRDVTECPECRSRFNINLHLRSYDMQAMHGLFDRVGFRCVQARNIAPESKWYGQDSYVRLRSYLRGLNARAFQSPICPVCGYRNDRFDPGSSSAESEAAIPKPHIVKRVVKAVWPRYLAPGYWVIGLYERRV